MQGTRVGNEKNEDKKIELIALIISVVNTILLLPCFSVSIINCFGNVSNINNIWTAVIGIILIIPGMLFYFAQCFYLSEILFGISIIMQIISSVLSVKNKTIKMSTIFIYVLSDVICCIAFISIESVFNTMLCGCTIGARC